MNVLLFIIAPLVVGYVLGTRGLFPERWITPVQRWVLMVPMPLVSMFALWGMNWQDRHGWLPVAGGGLAMAGLVVGALAWRFFVDDHRSGAITMICIAMSNLGQTGGTLVLLFLLGEQATAEGTLFISYFFPWTFAVVFPLGAHFSGPGYKGGGRLRDVLIAPHSMPVVGLVAGLVLLWKVPPPAWTGFALKVAMATVSIPSLTALGSRIRVLKVRHYIRESVIVSVTKFLVLPIAGVGLIHLFGFQTHTAQMVLVMAMCPVAVNALVVAHLFDLDVDLANSVFLVTTVVFFFVIVPLLWFALEVGLLVPYPQAG